MPDELDIKPGDDYAIRKQTPEEKERRDSTEEIPKYRIRVKLDAEQVDRLTKGVFLEYEALKDERQELGLEKRWEQLDNQYYGNSKAPERLMFNIHVHQTKIKEDAIVRALNEATLDSDPLVDVSARPEMSRQDMDEVAKRQGEFIDYAFDEEIKPAHEMTLINHCTVRKYVGISKLCWGYDRQRRKREECYYGENKVVGLNPMDSMPIIQNEGLEQFVKAFPDAVERYPFYIKKLAQGKDAEIVVEYFDIVNNNPQIKYIKVENFLVKNSTNGNEGLRKAHCVVEKQKYTWWELQEKEDNEEFEDVKRLASVKDDEDKQMERGYQTKEYDIIEVTYYFKLQEDDEEETKIKCWFSDDEKKVFLGAILWPYYAIDIDYKAFYVALNDKGFYGNAESVTWALQPSQIAQNALLNLLLHGTYIRNILTPIVKEGSSIEALFFEKRFIEGSPLSVDELTDDVNKAVGFVQWPALDTNGTVGLSQLLKKQDSDISGVSDLMTGRESPTDPSAPASKTIALLQQSGINIKDYIRTYIPSFNWLIGDVMLLYYQMAQEEGKKFRIRRKSEDVTGVNAFASISRDEMIAKTNIQSRAASFAFDKINEKQENLAMYQVLSADPYAMQLPNLKYNTLKTLMTSWSPRWKNIAETDLPSPEEFQKQLMQLAMEAVKTVIQQAQQAQQTTGVAPQVGPEQLAGAVGQAQTVAFNPQLAQEQK